MRKIEDLCVGCPQGCINCGNKRAVVYYCDNCKDSFYPHELAEVDDEELCKDCLFEKFSKVVSVKTI